MMEAAESYAMDDNEAPMSMECDICGTKDFYCESGYYYCSLCNTQSQQTRQYVEEQDFAPDRQFSIRRTAVLKDDKRMRVKYKDSRLFLSNWEVHNLIIKAMTDKLVSLGFPKTLKAKVFQIWSFYLTKRRAVFNLTNETGLAMSLKEPRLNLYALYDYQPRHNPGPKRAILIAHKPDDEFVSISQAKKQKSLSKRKAMESDYRLQATMLSQKDDAYDIVDTTKKKAAEDMIKEEMPEMPKPVYTPQSNKVRFALKTGESLKFGINYTKKTLPPGFGRGMEILSVEQFSIKTILILLFISLRQVGCKVVFSDLMRMLRDGTLYVQSMKLLLQEDELGMISQDSVVFLTSVYRFDNAVRCTEEIEDFLQYVGIKHFRYPQFDEMLPKFVDELKLPKEFECFAVQMNKLFPMNSHMEDLRGTANNWKSMAELWVLSTIGVLMKMLFGLDDVTEKHQSYFARAVNAALKNKYSGEPSRLDYKLLFVLEDWFKYMEIRNTIVRRELFNAQMYDPEQELNLVTMNNLISRFAGNKVLKSGTVSRGKAKALDMLNKVVSGQEGMPDIITIPDYITVPLPKETVMTEYRKLIPNVCYPEYKDTGYEDSFTSRRIDYLVHPERYFRLLKNEGYTVKVLRGDAKMYKEKLPKDLKTLIVFKPYKLYDDYIGTPIECSNSLKYIIQLFTDIAIGADKCGSNKPLFHIILGIIGELTARKCLSGFVPMANYDNINHTFKERIHENPKKRFEWIHNIKTNN